MGFRERREIERAAALGVDWYTMRIATSDRYSDGLHAIRHAWTFAEVFEAHVVLDVFEALAPTPKGK